MIKRFFRSLIHVWHDEPFLAIIGALESVIARFLSLAMMVVIIVGTIDLIRLLISDLSAEPKGFFSQSLFTIFGAFLNILIALEILENITGYLRKHVFQVELVIATSLIAVARKIIILDLDKTTGLSLIGLASAVLALAVSYWIIRKSSATSEG
ncbi:Putative membrane protein [Gloeomargarita lithophora Alchichica-D10]|uniref:Membrane protein n=1 Tax=Gloeomargarita lithophora Alchichica-D10 TaxID=1188229 RepID=A0A1J0ABC6_9CYAN|nr:phosphate-starvation-inducible PsiE family protein [Gloeomargarita lithophora]APB33231.1 Putative membrane protein [Gloeomargarita lithophora Alchichica-D10]